LILFLIEIFEFLFDKGIIGCPFWITPSKGYEDRLTILQGPCQNETSLNAVFIPGARLFFFLLHIMQVTGIQDARAPEKL
jgi:hypothetical protein